MAAFPIYDGPEIVDVLWQPVVGWKISLRYLSDKEEWLENTTPVTPMALDDEPFVLKYPDGSMTAIYDCPLTPDEDPLTFWNSECKPSRPHAAWAK
jgi:hypothetical protein